MNRKYVAKTNKEYLQDYIYDRQEKIREQAERLKRQGLTQEGGHEEKCVYGTNICWDGRMINDICTCKKRINTVPQSTQQKMYQSRLDQAYTAIANLLEMNHLMTQQHPEISVMAKGMFDLLHQEATSIFEE